MYTSSGARATFRHHARAEEALQYSSLIATEELTELLKPVVLCPSNIFRCDTRPRLNSLKELERHFRLSEYGSAATRQLLEGSRHRTVKREPNVRGNSSHSNDLEAAKVQGGWRQVIYIY